LSPDTKKRYESRLPKDRKGRKKEVRALFCPLTRGGKKKGGGGGPVFPRSIAAGRGRGKKGSWDLFRRERGKTRLWWW